MQKKQLNLLIILLLAGSSIFGIHQVKRALSPKILTPTTHLPLTVSVIEAYHGPLQPTLELLGSSLASHEVEIVSDINNIKIETIFVNEGDYVKQGQALLKLDASKLQNSLNEMLSEYERSFEAFKRVDALKDSGAVTAEMLISKKADLNTAAARLNTAKLNNQNIYILAPVDGMIIAKNINVGSLVLPSTILMKIAKNQEIEVAASIPEKYLPQLSLGQKAQIKFDGFPTQTAKISRIYPQIDKYHLLHVRFALEQQQMQHLGMLAKITIYLPTLHGSQLPTSAVHEDQSGNFVWSVSPENTAARLPITILYRDETTTLVKETLKKQQIITKAGIFLQVGSHINPVGQHDHAT
jgi:RND family efflux transporter MFP subunit